MLTKAILELSQTPRHIRIVPTIGIFTKVITQHSLVEAEYKALLEAEFGIQMGAESNLPMELTHSTLHTIVPRIMHNTIMKEAVLLKI